MSAPLPPPPIHKFSVFSTAVTLKIRSMSPKSNQSQLCLTAVTLKIRSRSQKSNQILLFHLYIHENLVTTGSQDIMQTRKCDADDNMIHTKINIPLPLGGGT